jgi:decaprenylphospho-beta-D-ribofuranose 2-oxidase
VPFSSYFYPLDRLRNWNLLYGPRGFFQYQLVVPFGSEAVLVEALEALARAGTPPLLAVLKRFGRAEGGPLSFPIPGFTLALDLPRQGPQLASTLDRLDELVAGRGGRVYLAKDARMRPEALEAMYPRLEAWREAQAEVDPEGVLVSDLARRLRLTASLRARR